MILCEWEHEIKLPDAIGKHSSEVNFMINIPYWMPILMHYSYATTSWP